MTLHTRITEKGENFADNIKTVNIIYSYLSKDKRERIIRAWNKADMTKIYKKEKQLKLF